MTTDEKGKPTRGFLIRTAVLVAVVVAATAAGVTALLINIVERKQEAKNPMFRVVEIEQDTVDPEI